MLFQIQMTFFPCETNKENGWSFPCSYNKFGFEAFKPWKRTTKYYESMLYFRFYEANDIFGWETDWNWSHSPYSSPQHVQLAHERINHYFASDVYIEYVWSGSKCHFWSDRKNIMIWNHWQLTAGNISRLLCVFGRLK